MQDSVIRVDVRHRCGEPFEIFDRSHSDIWEAPENVAELRVAIAMVGQKPQCSDSFGREPRHQVLDHRADAAGSIDRHLVRDLDYVERTYVSIRDHRESEPHIAGDAYVDAAH